MTLVELFRAAAIRRQATEHYARMSHRHYGLARRHVPNPEGPLSHDDAALIAERAAAAEEREPLR